MLVVSNHHVIVPETREVTIHRDHIIRGFDASRDCHVQRLYVNNSNYIILDFVPLSDQWIEIYLEGVRVINPRYATQKTDWVKYEEYNLTDNRLDFANNLTGNVKIVCDRIPRSQSEIRNTEIYGEYIDYENIQSYDTYKKRFTPARFTSSYDPDVSGLGLYTTSITARVGDAHYAYPLVLRQPIYGHVRPTQDRKDLVYVPKKNFYGWDVFTYTLMTQHGQIGKPECISVRTFNDGFEVNYSSEFDGNGDYYSIPSIYSNELTALAAQSTVIEFYVYVRAITAQANYTVGIFGQFPNAAQQDRYGVFLRGTSTFGEMVVVFTYSTSTSTFSRVSSIQKIKQRRWNHVVITIDPTTPAASTIWIYINGQGERFRNQNLASHTGDNGNEFYIGAVNDWTMGEKITQWFRGYLSNFRVIRANLIYSGETITIPNLPLDANIVGNVFCSLQSQQLDFNGNIAENCRQYRFLKQGNVAVKNGFGPFSPVWLELDKTQVWHGDTVTVRMNSDIIPVDTVIDYTISGNISTTNIGVSSFTGNFIVEEKETLILTIDNLTDPLPQPTDVVIRFHQYPMMFAEFTIYNDPDGCIAYYDSGNVDSYYGFGNNWIDLINGANITIPSTLTFNSSDGGVFQFTGAVNQRTELPDLPYLNLDRDMTCEVWFKIDTASTDWVRVLGKGGINFRTYGLLYNNSTNEFAFERVNRDGNLQTKHTTTISTSDYYQLVGTTDYKTHKLYVNGSLVATDVEDMAPFLSNSKPTSIGVADFGQAHSGNISIVRLYKRALTAAEVQNNWNQHRARYGL